MDALLVVDVQNDFMPWGALPVAEGDLILPVIADLMHRFDIVIATQDWHPDDHGSFASNQPGHTPGEFITLGGVEQVLWPDHCVQNTPGASFHSGLDVGPIVEVVRKGTDPNIDSYSGFFDNGHLRATGLADVLARRGVGRVYICGLATDYCVKATALDARSLGLDVVVVADACRAVEVSVGDGERAFEAMRDAGCAIENGDRVLDRLDSA